MYGNPEYDILPNGRKHLSGNCQTFARGIVQDLVDHAPPPDPLIRDPTPGTGTYLQLDNAPSDTFMKRHPRLTNLHRVTTKILFAADIVKTAYKDRGKEKESPAPLRPYPEW